MIYKLQDDLSKRERQIMTVIYKRKKASVQDVLEEIPNPPSYSAVRSIMNILKRKGFLSHNRHGNKYIYSPIISKKKAMNTAVIHLLTTYFDNSLEKAVTALLKIHNKDLTEEDLHRLTQIIDRAKKGGEG